ncbi:uncharacterized protein [Medicago truncatula]|uniref:uncharacterized protein n=1 Tax=Medicago truncatula TaxID=3880 RepID=UPI0000D5FD45|nr:uncharacterized protein LOC112421754 [Medicago truncatula]
MLMLRDAVINLEVISSDGNVGEFTVFIPNCCTKIIDVNLGLATLVLAEMMRCDINLNSIKLYLCDHVAASATASISCQCICRIMDDCNYGIVKFKLLVVLCSLINSKRIAQSYFYLFEVCNIMIQEYRIPITWMMNYHE